MNKTINTNNNSVKDYIASLDEQTAIDSDVLIKIMKKVSEIDPKFYNAGTIGFDTYHYKYETGREGDAFVIGFYPRKGKITIYIMDGTARYSKLLDKIGSHTSTGYCIYIKQLSDIDLQILEQLFQKSYENIKSQDGHINKILWKS